MPLDRSNLSVYLDELDNEPDRACDIARSLGMTHVCLRRVWSTNIGKATDNVCKALMSIIKKNNLKVLMVCTDDGRVPADKITHNDAIKRSLLVAHYFNATYFRPFVGLRTQQALPSHFDTYMATVAMECEKSAMIPLVEIDPDAHHFDPADVAVLLKKYSNWKLLYDPALLIIRRNQNPFIRYWHLLKGSTPVMDLHDFKTGTGFVPIGTGDCLIEDTIRDCVASNYEGWFIIEPGVSRHQTASADKLQAVEAAISNYTQMIVRSRIAISNTIRQGKVNNGQKRTQ